MSHSAIEESQTSVKPQDPPALGVATDHAVDQQPRSRNDTSANNGHQTMDLETSIAAHQESGRRSTEPTLSKWQKHWITLLVVATSQSQIASVFNRLDLQSYIGTSYVLGSTVFLPIFASLVDVFGRYWAMQTSVLFFITGSAISTGTGSMAGLLIGRGIAGIGAAGLLTVGIIVKRVRLLKITGEYSTIQ